MTSARDILFDVGPIDILFQLTQAGHFRTHLDGRPSEGDKNLMAQAIEI
jgi:hypothetical protein